MDTLGNLNLRREIASILKSKEKLVKLKTKEKLIKNNLIDFIKNDTILEYSLRTLEKIYNNFIQCLLSDTFLMDKGVNTLIAHDILSKNIPCNELIKAIQYFEESCIDILIMNINSSKISKCLTIINNLYNQTIYDISEEYFNSGDTTVFALAKLAELRDDTTGTHLERTKEYAVLLSKSLGLCSNFIRNIERASLLHDIGKVGIKDSILLNPNNLTEDEFEEMKTHTLIGSETINEIIERTNTSASYLRMAKDIALYHHEKYDGTGYPHGLKGNEIPLSARIFSIVDAYDAIVSRRPYKDVLDHNEAVKRILKDSRKHFDPYIVEVFLEIHQEFNKINNKYKQAETEAV